MLRSAQGHHLDSWRRSSISLVTESLPKVVSVIGIVFGVGEIGPGCGFHGYIEVEADFVAHSRELSAEFQ